MPDRLVLGRLLSGDRSTTGLDPELPLMNGNLRAPNSKLSNAHVYAMGSEVQ